MEEWSCAFFGHDEFNYEPYQCKIIDKIEFVIQRGVTHFYNCYRNKFDEICASAVDKLRKNYPQIKNIYVLSHQPTDDFELPNCFDNAIYLQNNNPTARFAARNFDRELVKSVDFVIFGVAHGFSRTKTIYSFAKRTLKSFYNVLTDKNYFWFVISPVQIDKAVRNFEHKMQTDEEFRLLHEEIMRRYTEQSAAFARKRAKKYKYKKHKEYELPVWITVETKKMPKE